jgi:hypothetical protein
MWAMPAAPCIDARAPRAGSEVGAVLPGGGATGRQCGPTARTASGTHIAGVLRLRDTFVTIAMTAVRKRD